MTGPVPPAAWQRLESRQVATNGIELRVVEHGEGPLVVLCHGFPELGRSWRHQVFALAAAGYRTMTPDLRGYGGSSRPARISAYDIRTLCADLAGLLDDVGAADALFVGHDWGASLVWHMALFHPERVRAVAGLSVPITPRSPVQPLSILRRRLGDDFYTCWFQEPGLADPVLDRNVRNTLLADCVDAAQWTANSEAGPLPPRPWQSEEDLAFLIQAFETTGFTGGLNYYRNIDRNWALTRSVADCQIPQPSLYITGSHDPFGKHANAGKLAAVLTDLRGHIVLDGAGHWIQQERPDEVTDALLRFFAALAP
ncbi:alpha/beta fold hydrolase [Spirillospora sp. CA-108201]